MRRVVNLLKIMWLAFFAVLPSFVKVRLLRIQGHRVGSNVRLGMSIFDIKQMSICDNVKIGNWNVFKNIKELSIGESSTIGKFNYFTCNDYYFTKYGNDAGRVFISNNTAITMKHYFDVQHKISIGAFSLIAGIETVMFTHQKGLQELNQAKPIVIGDYVYVGARSTFLPGTTIKGYAIVGAGSVMSGMYEDTYSLYMSPRAQSVKKLPTDSAYFQSQDPAGPNA